MMPTPQAIVAAARAWVGTPFQHQARVPGRGVDCAGVIVGVAAALGLPHQDITGYGPEPYKGQLQKALEAQCDRLAAPVPGCILLMRFATEPQHLAILTDTNTIVHAYAAVRKCVEHRLDDKWRRRIVAAYGYREAPWPS